MRRLILALALVPLYTWADTPAAPPKTSAPPPPTITEEDATLADSEVQVVQKDGVSMEEYRAKGQLYMIKVTPTHGVPYYLIDDDGSGTMKRTDPATRVTIPRWVLIRF